MIRDQAVNESPLIEPIHQAIKIVYLVPEKAPEIENIHRKMTFYIEAAQDAIGQPLYSYGISPIKHDQAYMDNMKGVYRLPEPLIVNHGVHPFIDSKKNIVLGRYDKDLKKWVDFQPTGQALDI